MRRPSVARGGNVKKFLWVGRIVRIVLLQLRGELREVKGAFLSFANEVERSEDELCAKTLGLRASLAQRRMDSV
ncbi:MAG: hypothetical protein V1856_00285 [Candidatus Liptonbacteria bacterium]